jgi:glycerol-3-phosphate dehydrogenase subunit C
MLRYRAVEAKKGETTFADRELAKTDRNGKLATLIAPVANWDRQRQYIDSICP